MAWSHIAREAGKRNASRLQFLHRALLTVAALGALMLFLVPAFAVPPFVQIYSHGQIAVSLREVMAFSAQVAIQLLAYAAAVFLNAMERVRLQFVFSLGAALLFVPMFHVLRAMGLDVASVPLSTAIVLLPAAIWFNVHVRRHVIRSLQGPFPEAGSSAGIVPAPDRPIDD